MKRGISLFLLYLALSLTLNSINVFSVNNPVLREQSILDQCNVLAKSDSDTIKVVLKTSQSNLVGVFLYDSPTEGDFGGSQIALLEKSQDNIYRFTYQNKEYTTTEPKNLDEIVYSDGKKICYIDETDKTGQRASTIVSACGNLVRGPVSLPVDLVGDGRMATAACEYSINWGEQPFGQYLPFSGSCVSFIPCPEEEPPTTLGGTTDTGTSNEGTSSNTDAQSQQALAKIFKYVFEWIFNLLKAIWNAIVNFFTPQPKIETDNSAWSGVGSRYTTSTTSSSTTRPPTTTTSTSSTSSSTTVPNPIDLSYITVSGAVGNGLLFIGGPRLKGIGNIIGEIQLDKTKSTCGNYEFETSMILWVEGSLYKLKRDGMVEKEEGDLFDKEDLFPKKDFGSLVILIEVKSRNGEIIFSVKYKKASDSMPNDLKNYDMSGATTNTLSEKLDSEKVRNQFPKMTRREVALYQFKNKAIPRILNLYRNFLAFGAIATQEENPKYEGDMIPLSAKQKVEKMTDDKTFKENFEREVQPIIDNEINKQEYQNRIKEECEN